MICPKPCRLFFQPLFVENLTKAKPLLLPLSFSTGMKISTILPILQNIASSSTFEIWLRRFETNSEKDTSLILWNQPGRGFLLPPLLTGDPSIFFLVFLTIHRYLGIPCFFSFFFEKSYPTWSFCPMQVWLMIALMGPRWNLIIALQLWFCKTKQYLLAF